MIKIAVFASGSGTNAENVASYFAAGEKARVTLILSNRPDAPVLERARRLGIGTEIFDRDTFYNSDRVVERLRREGIGYIVLAGFLWLVPDNLLGAYGGRILNVHPSLLPRHGGKGMYGDRVHRAVVESGDRETGITIHRVNEHYDSGDIVARYRTEVEPGDTPERVAEKVHALEYRYYPLVIEAEIDKLNVCDMKRKPSMRLLLISNSTNAGEAYLEYPKRQIADFLGGVRQVAFVPYAAVTFSSDDYLTKVQARFSELGIDVRSVHRESDPVRMLSQAEAIVVGGGNTFALVKAMQEQGLLRVIRERVPEGVPYVGWSAGSNVACPTICTTNDMPIVEPATFTAAGLVPFQINPHYTDAHPDGHAGETREQRLLEYVEANPCMTVAGLREGCVLRVENGRIELIGERPMRIFRKGQAPYEVRPGDDLNFLLD